MIIDGQGGRIGRLLTEQIKSRAPDIVITAVGTNSTATAAMMKAGADFGATGENPAAVCSADPELSLIAGPLGIVLADALLGEVTPKIAAAVGSSRAEKLLVPIAKCGAHVVGSPDVPLASLIDAACDYIIAKCGDKR